VRDEDLAPSRLALIDLKPESVDLVANSHLHYDHAGGNSFFRHAQFLSQFDELQGAMWPEPWERGNFFREDFDIGLNWIELDGDYDVFGDGRVTLIQTPGHTRGSQSLVVKVEECGSVILAQDAVYLNENIDQFKMPSMFWDMKAVARSMRKLRDLRRLTGSLLIPGHDWEHWATVKKAPAFYA
jgi:glyoxylase-like metal-dependent hydrolase (beta-lactamase superfamily II)